MDTTTLHISNAEQYGLLQLTTNLKGEQTGIFTLHGDQNGPDSMMIKVLRSGEIVQLSPSKFDGFLSPKSIFLKGFTKK